VSEAELPPAIVAVISAVVGSTRLWRREKVDVARELIAHFQDGLDAGRTAEQLVASFGDPVTAARLIRRAKRRGRPTLWHVLRWSLIGVIVLAFIYFLIGLYALSGRPSIKTDYLAIINHRALSVPEDEAAWPLYRKALTGILVHDEFPKFVEDGGLAPMTSDPAAAIEWLKRHAAAIETIRTASERPELGFAVGTSAESFRPEDWALFDGIAEPAPSNNGVETKAPLEGQLLVNTLAPHVQTLRSITWLLIKDAHWAAYEGDGVRALADIVAALGVSRHSQETPFLLNTYISIAIQEMTLMAIRDVMREHPELWSDAQLGELAHTVVSATIDWRRGFDGERAAFADVLQRAYTDDGRGNGRLTVESLEIYDMLQPLLKLKRDEQSEWLSRDQVALIAAPAAMLLIADRHEMQDEFNRYLDQWPAQFDQPLWHQNRDPEEEINLKQKKAPLDKVRYWLVNLCASSFLELRNQYAAIVSHRDGVLLGIALELYRRDHGAWPDSLSLLSPRWLPTLPVDPITGKPLRYRIVNDRPAVYSVGVDRDDDCGRGANSRDEDTTFDSTPTSPLYFDSKPVAGEEHDGDWVIWSTVKGR
jgi:hypothetical protein